MRAPDGRPFVRDGVGEQLRAGRKTEDVLSRRLDRQPKIPEASAGGISGATRCDAWDYDTLGGPQFYGIDWNFSSLYGSTGPTIATGADPNAVYVSAAGWYQATLNFNVSFSTVPAELGARIAFDGENEDYSLRWTPLFVEDNAPSPYDQIRNVVSTPIIYLAAGAALTPSLGWDGAATVGTFHHFTLDVVKFA